MEIINNELRLFVKDITLFLQRHSNYTPEKIEPMFQRAYKLYVKYDVENEQAVEADAESRCPECSTLLDDGKCWDCIGDGGICSA